MDSQDKTNYVPTSELSLIKIDSQGHVQKKNNNMI